MKRIMEVESTGQHGPMTAGSSRNGVDLKNLCHKSQQRRQIELWLLLNTNLP